MLLESKTLHQAFFKQSKKTPTASCLVDENVQLSYFEVEQYIKTFSQVFQSAGIKKNTVVGLYSEKRVELIIAFLAVSALGGRCLQLDKAFPNRFLNEVITETATTVMLCDNDMVFEGTKTINIVELYNKQTSEDISNAYQNSNNVSKNDIVWLVYSSGTTGTHKGIAIAHKAILASYDMRNEIKDYTEQSRVGCSIYYLWEVFRPMLKGGCSYIINDNILHDFGRLTQFIERHQINDFLFTPSYLEMLLHAEPEAAKRIFEHLHTCWLNGEIVSSGLYHQLIPYMEKTNIYNLYSISECHDVAVYRLTKKDSVFDNEQVIPVGYLLKNVETVLLDEKGDLCSPDQKGELYVYSPGLAEEYINRIELNQERFIPANKSPIGKRLYKTGDLARLIENGQLVIIYGRCDYFVRLRGYNISLPFLEAILKEKLEVVHCVVVKEGQTSASEYLVAYIEIPSENQVKFKDKWNLQNNAASSQELVSYLAEHVPNYMVPQTFNIVSEIPINPYSNKLDRKGLVKSQNQFDITKFGYVKNLRDYRKLWSTLLNLPIDRINNQDGFFDLGGTSLIAMVLISHAPKLSLNRVNIKDFIANSTFEQSYQLFMSQQSAEQDNKLAVLKDIDISINQIKEYFLMNKPHRSRNQKPKEKVCLLTGATGFLGSHILQHLLLDTKDKIVCLVRGENDEASQERIKSTLKKLGLNAAQYVNRIIIQNGDLSNIRLGLSIKQWQALASDVDYVINAAANVNLILPYQSMKKVCVNGVKNMVEVCLKYYLKPFYHVSTNGIFPENQAVKPENGNVGNYIYDLNSGYSQAKWASERILNETIQLGLPVTIFRPGNIFAELKSNINDNDMNWLILKSIKEIGAVPKGLNLEMTSVEKIAQIIVYSSQQELSNQYFNMINPKYLSGASIAKHYHLKIIPADKWLDQVKDEKLTCLLENYDGWLDAEVEYQQDNYDQLCRKLKISNENIAEYPLISALFSENLH